MTATALLVDAPAKRATVQHLAGAADCPGWCKKPSKSRNRRRNGSCLVNHRVSMTSPPLLDSEDAESMIGAGFSYCAGLGFAATGS